MSLPLVFIFYRIRIVDTLINGKIYEEMFKPISFTEVEVTYNNFNYVDNHAFRSSAKTLQYLNLSKYM